MRLVFIRKAPLQPGDGRIFLPFLKEGNSLDNYQVPPFSKRGAGGIFERNSYKSPFTKGGPQTIVPMNLFIGGGFRMTVNYTPAPVPCPRRFQGRGHASPIAPATREAARIPTFASLCCSVRLKAQVGDEKRHV